MAIGKVAFIVICWNNKTIIKDCIDAINSQTYKNKIVYIVDNNSSDGSADYIEDNFHDIKLIRSAENCGFARGNNIAIKEALDDDEVGYIALVNSDAIIEKDWSENIVKEARRRPKAACLQGITIDYFNRNLVDSHHIYMANNFQSVQYGFKDLLDEKSYFPRRVMGVNAAAAIYTRQFIESQPFDYFFDEKFFMYLEDVDVSMRALALGWDNYFVSKAKAYHMGSASSNKRSSDFSLYYTARNQYGLIFKNLPFSIIIKHLSSALKFERHFTRHLRKKYGKKTANTYIRGRVVGFFRSFIYWSDRFKIQTNRRISNSLLDEFIRNKGITK